jgi:hypothetical protein
MRAKSTWQLFLVVVALLAFILLWERRGPSTGERVSHSLKLFPNFLPSQVTQIDIQPQAAARIRLERTNDLWVLTQPVSFPGHTLRITQFLDTIKSLASFTQITAQELLDRTNHLAPFGLDPPQTIVVLSQAQARIEFRLGCRSPIGTQAYCQVVGRDGVYVIPSGLLDRMPATVDEWRDNSLLGARAMDFDRLEARMGAPFGFALQHDPTNHLWRLLTPMVARADNPKVDQLVHQLKNAQVSRFLPDPPAGNLELWGLNPAQLELVLGPETNALVVLRFGISPTNSPGEVYALNFQHSNLFLADKELVDRLKVSYTELRDRHLFSGALDGVNSIEINADESFALQRQTNQQWRVVRPISLPADTLRVQDFLNRLGDLEIKEFTKDVVTDFSSFGLAPPARQYLLKQQVPTPSAGGSNVVVVDLGFGTNQPDRVLVRRGDENSVYAVSLEDFDRLPHAAYQLRDRRIWSFASTNVAGLVFTIGGQTRRLNRAGAVQWTLGTTNSPLAEPLPLMLEELVIRLGSLQADPWIARGEDKMVPYGFLKPEHHTLEIRLTQQADPLTIDLGEASPLRSRYAAVVLDGQRMIFELNPSLYSLYWEVVRQLPATVASP